VLEQVLTTMPVGLSMTEGKRNNEWREVVQQILSTCTYRQQTASLGTEFPDKQTEEREFIAGDGP
jgi:hypothetical protein